MSHEGYMSFSRWPRTHALLQETDAKKGCGHEAKQGMAGGRHSGIPWGFPPPAPPRRPQPFFAPVSCSNFDCMCAWPP